MDRWRNRVWLTLSLCLLLHENQVGVLAQETTLNGHAGAVMMSSFAAENGRVVTASSDQTAKLWDVTTATELQSFNQHTGPLYCLAVSGDGRTLVTGAQDNTLRIWDLPLSHSVRQISEAGPGISDIVLSSDGKTLLAGCSDNSVKLFELAASGSATPQSEVFVRTGHRSRVLATAYRNDGNAFATADDSGQICVWSPDLNNPIASLHGHPGKVSAIVLPNSDQRLASGGDDGCIRVWQLPKIPAKSLLNSEYAGLELSTVPGKDVGVLTLASGDCLLVDLQTGDTQKTFPHTAGEVLGTAVAPNQAWLARSYAKGHVEFLKMDDGNAIGQLAGDQGTMTALSACQNGQQLVTVGKDGTTRLWKLPIPAVTLPGHSGIVRRLVSSRNGQWSLTVSDDLTIRRWSATGAPIAQFTNHTTPISAITIRDDDSVFATGNKEGAVWIWNATNGEPQGVVSAHTAAVTALQFSPDHKSLVSSAADGTMRCWNLPLPGQETADGEDAIKPEWEFMSSDAAPVTQFSSLSQDAGILAITATGDSILRFKWDGSSLAAIPSPAGTLRQIDVSTQAGRILATVESGQVHLFGLDGTLEKSLPPLEGLKSAKFNKEGNLALMTNGQSFVQLVEVGSGRTQERISTPFPVTNADWTGEDQRSFVCTGAGPEVILVQSALLRSWDIQPGEATAVTITPDQKTAFTGTSEGPIYQWNLAEANSTNNDPVRILKGHSAAITEMTVSSDGKKLSSVGADRTLRVWDLNDGALIHTLQHPHSVHSVSMSPDSSRVATGCSDGIVRLWDIKTGVLLESLQHHSPGSVIHSVRFLNDGVTIVSTGDDMSVVSSHMTIASAIAIHSGAIRSMVPFTSGAQVLTLGDDARVLLTNLSNGNQDREYITGDRKPVAVAARPDGQRVAAGCESGEAVIWNANDGTKPLFNLQLDAAITSLTWSPDNRKLALATADNTVSVFAPSRQGVQPVEELMLHQRFKVTSPVENIVFASDSLSFWLAHADGTIDEWGYAGPEQRRQFNHGGPVYGVAVTHNGATVVSCSSDQTVRVWDTTIGQQKYQLTGHNGAIHAVAMSPDETFAVSSGADGTLRLWDIVGGRQLKQLVTYNSTMYSLAVHPHGTVIAAAGADRMVHVLDMISGVEQKTLVGHTDYIHSVTFSPDGSKLLSYGYAGQLKLWNAADGVPIAETRIGRVGNTAQFSPDGLNIVIANGDATATVVTVESILK